MEYFKPLKLTVGVPLISLLLYLLSLTGAVTFPVSLTQGSALNSLLTEILLLLLTSLVLNLVGRAIGEGVFGMGKLHPRGAILLTFVGVYVLGSILAIFTLLNIPYTAHLNLFWKGGSWYDPWITMLIVGSPILLGCMV